MAKAPDLRLSERLFAIAKNLPEGGTVCDVGSDHGILPLYLLESGKISRALVTDLNPLPLARAKQKFADADLSHLAKFVLADGILELLPENPDSFVIAGMGGETIGGILERGLSEIPKGCFFVLQPMTKIPFLRRFLYENGFCVTKEEVVFENGKYFLIFCARFDGKKRQRDDLFYCSGEFLPKQKTDAVKGYFRLLIQRVQSKKQGKEKAGEDVLQESKLLSQLEEYYENL